MAFLRLLADEFSFWVVAWRLVALMISPMFLIVAVCAVADRWYLATFNVEAVFWIGALAWVAYREDLEDDGMVQ